MREKVERKVQLWINLFMTEVDRIETFFTTTLEQLIKEFQKLEIQYKMQYETENANNSMSYTQGNER